MSFRVRALRTSPRFALRSGVRAAVLCGALALFATAAPAFGQDTGGAPAARNAVALQVGALGLGVEYSRSFGDRIAIRGAVYGSHVSFDGDQDDIEYASDLVWDSFAV